MNSPLRLLLALVFAGCCLVNARAQLYVVYTNAGLISEYDADSGKLINETLVLGLSQPHGLCFSDGALYVCQTGNGTIGKFDAKTGNAINPALVTGLHMPQALAVDGDVLYVSDFEEHGESKIGKYNAKTGATMSPEFIAQVATPEAMSVGKGKLYVALGQGMGAVGVYDATTGAAEKDPFGRRGGGHGMALLDNTLYVVGGSQAPTGYVFKLDVDTGLPTGGVGFIRPLITGLDYPTAIAISGDYLYVSSGGDQTVGQYNAVTGAVINPKFVPHLGDRLGGIAVVPKESTGKFAYDNAKFEVKAVATNFALLMMSNGSYVFLGTGALVALVVVGLFFLFLPRKVHVPVQAIPEQATAPAPVAEAEPALEIPEPEITPLPAAPKQPVPVQPVVPMPYSFSKLAMVGLSIVVVTFIATSIVGYFVYQWAIMNRLVQMNSRDVDQGGLVGVWLYSNDETRRPDEMPVFKQVSVYPNRLEYSAGNGTRSVQGQWRESGFWGGWDPDSSSEMEIARLLGPEKLELQMSAFDSGSREKLVLYKEQGSAAEMRELAAKYPPPITYPPPAGLIKPGMTEYELKSLPWKPDSLERTSVEQYDQGVVYFYRSDSSQIEPLKVTVKNHLVVLTHGGNG